MAGFFILNKEKSSVTSESIINAFENNTFINGQIIDKNNLVIGIYKKELVNHVNFREYPNGDFIASHGTFIYKEKCCDAALNLLYNDFLKNEIEQNEISGHYNFIIQVNNKITVLCDPLFTLPIYYYEKQGLIGTSFVSLCDVCNNLSIDNLTLIENIITGCQYGKQTIFNEIIKINESLNYSTSIEIRPLREIKLLQSKINIANFEDEVKNQLMFLLSYLDRIKILIKKGVDIGLSAGYDSRLILALLNSKYNNNLQVHTHWKKRKNIEIRAAEKLSQIINKKLIQIPVKSFDKMTDEEKENTLYQSLLFYDGQIRVNHSFASQYRNKAYRKNILNGFELGMTGLGGEIFRNDYSFFYKSYDYKKFIQSYVFDGGSEYTIDAKLEKELTNSLKNKLYNYLGKNLNEKKITRFEIERFMFELWVRNGPGIRNAAENKISFFLSPFNDINVIEKAYEAFMYKGIMGRFQASMIYALNTEIAKIESEYGINFANKNKLYNYIRYLEGIFLPYKKQRKVLARRLKKEPVTNFIKDINDEYEKSLLEVFNKYISNFKINTLSINSNIFHRVLGMAYILKHYEKKF